MASQATATLPASAHASADGITAPPTGRSNTDEVVSPVTASLLASRTGPTSVVEPVTVTTGAVVSTVQLIAVEAVLPARSLSVTR